MSFFIDAWINGQTIGSLVTLSETLRGLSLFIQPLINAYDVVKISLSSKLKRDFGCNIYSILDYDYIRTRGKTVNSVLKDSNADWSSIRKDDTFAEVNALTTFLDTVAPALHILFNDPFLFIALTEGASTTKKIEALALCFEIEAKGSSDFERAMHFDKRNPLYPPCPYHPFDTLFETLNVAGNGPWAHRPPLASIVAREKDNCARKINQSRFRMQELGNLIEKSLADKDGKIFLYAGPGTPTSVISSSQEPSNIAHHSTDSIHKLLARSNSFPAPPVGLPSSPLTQVHPSGRMSSHRAALGESKSSLYPLSTFDVPSTDPGESMQIDGTVEPSTIASSL